MNFCLGMLYETRATNQYSIFLRILLLNTLTYFTLVRNFFARNAGAGSFLAIGVTSNSQKKKLNK